nr:uncharacterized protein LOC109167537 [Ipomoea batatas]
MAKTNHLRSISFPSRSHPSIQKVEEELTKLKTLQVSVTPEAATISSGLLGLEQLYKCMDGLLNLPQTLQALSQNQNKKWVDGLLEKSVRLLDICGLARDSVSQLKEQLRDLQSSLRRRKGDSSTEATITRYTSFIKKMNKDAKKSIAALKKINVEIDVSTPLDVHHDISAVIRALREASAVSTSTFQSVLLFLSVPVLKPKTSRWSVVSKLVQNGRVACEYQHDNTCNLETLEAQLEDIENTMESIFSCGTKQIATILERNGSWNALGKLGTGSCWRIAAVAKEIQRAVLQAASTTAITPEVRSRNFRDLALRTGIINCPETTFGIPNRKCF